MSKHPGFFEGVGLALLASIIAGAGFFVLAALFPGITVFRFLVAVVAFIYVCYLLLRSDERVGRISVLVIWSMVAVLNWLFSPSIILYLVLHLGMIWLIRSLYYYGSILSSLADLTLTGTSMVVAIWVWSTTRSLFLSFWCFFLVQALFTLIPAQWKKLSDKIPSSASSEDSFERAHRAAEYAVRKLSNSI